MIKMCEWYQSEMHSSKIIELTIQPVSLENEMDVLLLEWHVMFQWVWHTDIWVPSI